MAIGKVVVLTRGPMDKDRKDIFMSETPKGWQPIFVGVNEGEAKIVAEMADAEYVLTLGSGPTSQKWYEGAKKLKLIQTGGQDTGHLPVRWALEHNIFVANAGGANAISVAENVILLILACLRRFPQFTKEISAGNWRGTLDRKSSHELYCQTVGIIGFGNIGRRVAYLCYAFGANVIYHERFFVPYALRADTRARPVGLDELLRTADIVTLHVPSFSANRKMIDYEALCKMKPTAYLINTSRGANVDEDALVRALNEKKITAAALDVFDPEPPKPDNPLLNMPNVIATPHISATAWENTRPGFETVWRNVVLVSEGKDPLNRIREY
jgi:phosphoglycerate dehydrogenase-like enzyme